MKQIIDDEWDQTEERVKAHYSSLSLHRKCPQAWYYRYDMGLSRPLTTPAPELHFGSWFGALRAAEAVERGRKLGSLLGSPNKFSATDRSQKFDAATVTPQDIFDAAAAWWDLRTLEERADWDDRLGEALPARQLGAYERWHDEWGDAIRKERPLGVELFWKRELPRPKGDAEWDALAKERPLPKMYLLGYIDELYEDTDRGIVVVRDVKTSKQLATQSAADDMMDSQLQLYAWGISPKLQEWGAPPVRGVAYDRVKSVKPTAPKLTLAGKLSAASTMFDERTYREFAAGPDGKGIIWGVENEHFASGPRKGEPKWGTYEIDQAVLDRITSIPHRSAFHQRTLVPLNANIVRAHLRAAVDSATDIWRTQKRAEITGEAARNMGKTNCQWCDYQSICRAQMIGGADGTYELAEHNLTQRDGLLAIGGQ